MDNATITTSTFTLGGVAGTVSYNAGTRTATFDPTSNLAYGRTYTATITTGAKDLAGNSLTSSYSWSFTTESAPVRRGGGGGGASPLQNVPTESTGEVTSATTISSSDETAWLTIPAGTTALDGDGEPLEYISITPISLGGTVAAFSITPDGATFNPPITLTVSYDPDDVPEGGEVVIKMFDGTEWIELTTTVDPATNTATVEISHFTVFALFAEITPAITPTPAPTVTPPTVTVTPTPAPTVTPPGLINNRMLIIVGIIAVIVIGGAAVYYYTKKKA
jgi:hypothetical protein